MMMSAMPIPLLLALFLILLSSRLIEAENEAFVEEMQCGILYSEKNNSGSAFVLMDFDQSVNTKKDYRTSVSGWQKTGSIQIEKNCTMNVCTGTYFQGTCYSLPAGSHQDTRFTTNINSANCTCARDSQCDDIHIPKSDFSCGRAYLKSASNNCDSEYLVLQNEKDGKYVPVEYAELIQTIILRTGCKLVIWTDRKIGERTVVTGNTYSATVLEKVEAYECDCDNDAYAPPKIPTLYPLLINLPETKDELINLLSSNLPAAKHPGMQAAINSCKTGRSQRNAYILLIGAPNPSVIGLNGCSNENEKIGVFRECHFKVNLDKLGVSNAQLRVIYASIAPVNFDKGEKQDSRWAATLAWYLSNHEDLKDSIPNAVIVYHFPVNDSTIANESSRFKRKLRILNSLLPFIVDEEYSNIIFYLFGLSNVLANTKERIKTFEAAIHRKWTFPVPTFISLRTFWSYEQPMLNGYWKMQNGEFQPRNLQKNLNLISEKCKDPLGREIFNAVYPVEKQNMGVVRKVFPIFPENHNQVELYRNSSLKYIQNIAGIKHRLQVRRHKLITQAEGIQNVLGNSENLIHELIKKMEAKIERMIAEEKIARQGEMEKLKNDILAKIRIDLDQIFE